MYIHIFSLPQTVEFAPEPLALEEPDFLSHLQSMSMGAAGGGPNSGGGGAVPVGSFGPLPQLDEEGSIEVGVAGGLVKEVQGNGA